MSGKHWIKGVAATSVVAALFIGGIALFHTPYGKKLPIGRKLLGLMGIPCPLERSQLSAEQVEATRQIGVRALRGFKTAPARPALIDLKMDQTTESEAWGWAKARDIQCVPKTRGMRFIKC